MPDLITGNKTEAQINAMRKGGKILARILRELCEAAKIGSTGIEIDEYARKKLKEYGINRKKIQLIESLLFLSMVPLHSDSYDRQLLMISLGIEKINKFLKEEDE